MDDMVKSGILGIITVIMLFVGAYFTNDNEVVEMEEKTVEVDNLNKENSFDKNTVDIKKAEAAL